MWLKMVRAATWSTDHASGGRPRFPILRRRPPLVRVSRGARSVSSLPGRRTGLPCTDVTTHNGRLSASVAPR